MGFVLVAVIAAAIWFTPSPPQSKVVLLPGADHPLGGTGRPAGEEAAEELDQGGHRW